MIRNDYLDIKTIKKHARELRRDLKAVIELAGSIHYETEEYDQFRDSEMRYNGLHVLQLKNEELFDMHNTLVKIRSYLDSIT